MGYNKFSIPFYILCWVAVVNCHISRSKLPYTEFPLFPHILFAQNTSTTRMASSPRVVVLECLAIKHRTLELLQTSGDFICSMSDQRIRTVASAGQTLSSRITASCSIIWVTSSTGNNIFCHFFRAVPFSALAQGLAQTKETALGIPDWICLGKMF